MNRDPLSALLFIPSFYGFVAWGVCLALYSVRLLEWFPSIDAGVGIFLLTVISFLAATLLYMPAYGRVLDGDAWAKGDPPENRWRHAAAALPDKVLALLHGLGLLGLFLYLREISAIFGGLDQLIDVLASESYLIRQSEVDLIGIYISYFGWIAIPLTMLKWRATSRLPWWLFIAVLLQFSGNLLFIDRTRPIWLAFVSLLIIFPLIPRFQFHRLVVRMLVISAFAIGAFFAIGLWIGKTGAGLSYYGYVGMSDYYAVLYYYLTSGFAYFENMLIAGQGDPMGLARSLYPLYKAGSMLGLVAEPPSQILPFEEVPFPANVGTFLEPYFMDGGYPLVLVAILVHTFGLNAIALAVLRGGSPWGTFLWATLCFVAFISFFVPKLVSTPVWMFFVIALTAMTFARYRHRPHIGRPAPEAAPRPGHFSPRQ